MVQPNGAPVLPSPSDDPSHPLYIHPSDNPGSILVTELLNGSNYLDWSRSMQTALLAKNKLGFVDGSIVRPDFGDPLLKFWIRSNSMVVSWLRNATIPQIRSSLLYITNAAQIWSDLKERFSQGDDARIYHLKHQLFNLRQGAMDVNSYYTNLHIIWDEYTDFQPKAWCECNGCRCNSSVKWREYQQKDFNMHFLMGLNDSYASLRTHLISMDPLPGFGKVFSLVLQEERQRSAGFTLSSIPPAPVSEPLGMLTNASQSAFGRTKDRLHCTHCGKNNHTIDQCFQLHGFHPGFGRGRGRPPDNVGSNSSSAHQVNAGDGEFTAAASANVVPSLSNDQCVQLITFLQQRLSVSGSSPTQQPVQSTSSSASISPPQVSQSAPDPNLISVVCSLFAHLLYILELHLHSTLGL